MQNSNILFSQDAVELQLIVLASKLSREWFLIQISEAAHMAISWFLALWWQDYMSIWKVWAVLALRLSILALFGEYVTENYFGIFDWVPLIWTISSVSSDKKSI